MCNCAYNFIHQTLLGDLNQQSHERGASTLLSFKRAVPRRPSSDQRRRKWCERSRERFPVAAAGRPHYARHNISYYVHLYAYGVILLTVPFRQMDIITNDKIVILLNCKNFITACFNMKFKIHRFVLCCLTFSNIVNISHRKYRGPKIKYILKFLVEISGLGFSSV